MVALCHSDGATARLLLRVIIRLRVMLSDAPKARRCHHGRLLLLTLALLKVDQLVLKLAAHRCCCCLTARLLNLNVLVLLPL